MDLTLLLNSTNCKCLFKKIFQKVTANKMTDNLYSGINCQHVTVLVLCEWYSNHSNKKLEPLQQFSLIMLNI